MGLNFEIACHQCRRYRWMLRGDESSGIHQFVREHRDHMSTVFPFTDDQKGESERWDERGYVRECWPPDEEFPDTVDGLHVDPPTWCGADSMDAWR